MKLPRLVLLAASLLSLAGSAGLHAADAPATAAGYWEGSIALPNRELGISVELTPATGAAWQGLIDIPMQGLRGFKLDPVKVDGSTVEFGLPGIPGEPRFTGKLSEDGKTISGDFAQGGGSLPFTLERKTKPAPVAREAVPARGTPGKGVAGNWRGALAPLPNVELRLELEATTTAEGKLEGVIISLDQGNARIPITEFTIVDNKVNLKTPSVEGAFSGTLSADGAEIAGEWTQLGRTSALVFKRLPASP